MKKIKSGSYGEIYSDGLVAVKRPREGVQESISHEYSISLMFDHPNVMKYDSLNDSCITMKLCSGDLSNFSHTYSRDKLMRIVGRILQGLRHMHQCGYSHSDLKAANILINNDSVYISDFGNTCEFGTSGVLTSITHRGPEQPTYLSGPYTDIWSIGCLIYECLYGVYLISDDLWHLPSANALVTIIDRNYNDNYPYEYLCEHQGEFTEAVSSDIEHPIVDLMLECLTINHHARPSADQLIKKYF